MTGESDLLIKSDAEEAPSTVHLRATTMSATATGFLLVMAFLGVSSLLKTITSKCFLNWSLQGTSSLPSAGKAENELESTTGTPIILDTSDPQPRTGKAIYKLFIIMHNSILSSNPFERGGCLARARQGTDEQ